MKIAMLILATLVVAGAGFAGGWISGRATKHNKSCAVLPAWTDHADNPLLRTVYPPELKCE